jgi:L-lactate utilization protein LutB
MMTKSIQTTMDNLRRNGFEVHYHETEAEAKAAILADIAQEETVGFGGSMTLNDMEIYEALKERGTPVSWAWKLSPGDDRLDLQMQSAIADVFLTSTNAITEDGSFVNIDGTGNRIAGMLFGHKRVLIVSGTNKIVRTHEEAILRIKNVATPANAKRLGKKTPCATTGKCMNCDSPDRICKATLTIDRQPGGNPIILHLIQGSFGY